MLVAMNFAGPRWFWVVLFLLSAPPGQSSGSPQQCCPVCSTRSVDPLDAAQVAQVRGERAFIEALEENPDLLFYPQNQRPVVTLTAEQEDQLLRNHPQMFVDRRTFEESHEATAGTITVPSVNLTKSRRQRRATQLRVCDVNPNPEPLILIRKADGQVVQIAKTPHFDQWILQETCTETTDPATGQTCGYAEREVLAIFVNLSGILRTGGTDEDFDDAYVIVQSCVTLR